LEGNSPTDKSDLELKPSGPPEAGVDQGRTFIQGMNGINFHAIHLTGMLPASHAFYDQEKQFSISNKTLPGSARLSVGLLQSLPP
jgi:hypothetical protein